MDVSIIYVNWNCAAETLQSVASVRACNRSLSSEIIVVDNDSAEGVEDLERTDIRLIRNDRNAGFGAACNRGAKEAGGEYLFFLNPDTRLLNDAVTILVSFLSAHTGAGGAGAMVLEEDGAIHFGAARSFPSLGNEILEHTTLAFKFPRSRFFGRPYYSYWAHDSTRVVDSLLGACMMFKRSIFEAVGGFDERFFLYYEENDLCRRVRDAGWDIYYVHTARVLHKGKQSTLKFYGQVDRMIFQYLESAWRYFRKHHGRVYAGWWRLQIAGIYLCRYLLRRRPVFWAYFRWAVGLDRCAANRGPGIPAQGRGR